MAQAKGKGDRTGIYCCAFEPTAQLHYVTLNQQKKGTQGVFLKGCRPRESHRGGEGTNMVGRAGVAGMGQVRLPEMA